MNFNESSKEYTHGVVIRFRSGDPNLTVYIWFFSFQFGCANPFWRITSSSAVEAFEIFIRSQEYKDVRNLYFLGFLKHYFMLRLLFVTQLLVEGSLLNGKWNASLSRNYITQDICLGIMLSFPLGKWHDSKMFADTFIFTRENFHFDNINF